jgi:uncharacterized protein YjlB
MRIERGQHSSNKGWYVGPWNSKLTVSIGYAHVGVDEPHLHTSIHEIYLVSRGSCHVRIERETVQLVAGDVLIVQPGEAHTFLQHSADYFHFVLHVPGRTGADARADKVAVEWSQLEEAPPQ